MFKRAVLAISLALLIGSTWYWHSEGWRWIQIQYWQRQCLHYSPPADQIVFDEYPRERLSLLTQPGYFTSFHAERNDATAFRPAIIDEFLKASGYGLIPDPQNRGRAAICFLGELNTPSGESRLVIVQWSGMAQYPRGVRIGPGDPGNVAAWAQVIAPHPLFGPGSIMPRGNHGLSGLSIAVPTGAYRSPNERVWAGQVDPADPSHFTIRYEIWGKQDILDGRIDNNDQVMLTPRHQPTTVPWR